MTSTARSKVLPRDLQPGDKIDRVNLNLDIVQATVKDVVKTRKFDRTSYKVYMVEQDALNGPSKALPENRHLVPFVLHPTNRIDVEREVTS